MYAPLLLNLLLVGHHVEVVHEEGLDQDTFESDPKESHLLYVLELLHGNVFLIALEIGQPDNRDDVLAEEHNKIAGLGQHRLCNFLLVLLRHFEEKEK